MFKQKNRREAAITTLVGADTRVQGDIEFTGGCLVDGYVKGNVRSSKDEHATLSISERGCVEGTVEEIESMIAAAKKKEQKKQH